MNFEPLPVERELAPFRNERRRAEHLRRLADERRDGTWITWQEAYRQLRPETFDPHSREFAALQARLDDEHTADLAAFALRWIVDRVGYPFRVDRGLDVVVGPLGKLDKVSVHAVDDPLLRRALLAAAFRAR